MFSARSANDKIDILVTELRSNDPERRFGAVRALGESRNRGAVTELMRALTHEDYLVRCASACALGQLRIKRAVKALANCLCDPEAVVRQEAAGALWEIGRGRPDIRSMTLEPQVAAFQDPDPNVRRQIVWNLGDSRQSRWIRVLSDILTADSDCEVRLTAARGLGKIGSRRIVVPLVRALQADGDDDVRCAASEILGNMRDKRVIDPLAAALAGDSCSRVRATAASALARFPAKGVRASLLSALRDDDATVRIEVAHALHQIKAKRLVRLVFRFVGALIGFYIGIIAMSIIGSALSDRIETKKDLRVVVVQEAHKLGIDPGRVDCRLRRHFEGGIWLNRSSGIARLEVGGLGATRVGVRHELYHLARGHLEPGGHVWGFTNDSFFGHWFIEEPQAIIYSCTGIKL